MRFPETFSTDQKVTFYKQRRSAMKSRLRKSKNEEFSLKLQGEIDLCNEALNLLK